MEGQQALDTRISEIIKNGRERLSERPKVLRLNGKQFVLEEIAPEVDVSEEIARYFQEQVDRIMEETSNALSEGCEEEHQRQLQRIAKAREEKTIAVPEEYKNSLVAVNSGTVCEARVALYNPTRIRVVAGYLPGEFISEYGELYKSKDGGSFASLSSDCPLVVYTTPPFVFPVVYVYNKKTDRILTPWSVTAHTLSSQGVCLGGTPPKDYWGLGDDEFSETMSRVNYMSLGSSYIFSIPGPVTGTLVEQEAAKENKTWYKTQTLIMPDSITKIVPLKESDIVSGRWSV